MANEQNLNPPFSKNSPNLARESQKKSVAARRRNAARKKTIAETVEKVLCSKVADPKQLAIIKKSGMPTPKNPTYKDFIVASVIMKCVKKGDVGDLSKLMEIIGETPIQEDSAALQTAQRLLSSLESVIE